MRQLRIIAVMIEPPLPFGNAAARWFYVLLKGLVERGHHVTAFASCSKPEEIAKAKILFPAPQYDLRCYPEPHNRGLLSKWQTFRRPYSFMFSRELRRDLDRELACGFDVLHLEQLLSGWLGLRHVDRTLVNVHYLAWVDLAQGCTPGWRERLKHWLRLSAERRLVGAYQHFRCCSSRLTREILRVNSQAHVTTIPLGLDCGQYEYIPEERRTTAPVVSVIGTMTWYPTWSAATRMLNRLWPAIKARVPEAKVQIVGWNARVALREFLGRPDVTIEENVPDIRPYFERTAVLLYPPVRGSGMKIKVQEALAYGVPVVTTGEGVEGLPAQDGVHAGICEDDAGLIERTVTLLGDREAQERQRAAGRQLLEAHCAAGPILDALEAIYDRMTTRGR